MRAKKIFDQKIFSGHLSHMETQLGAKNQKKCRTVKAVGPERTNGRIFFVFDRFFFDFRDILTLPAFFSVPDSANGKCIIFYNFCPIELIFVLN